MLVITITCFGHQVAIFRLYKYEEKIFVQPEDDHLMAETCSCYYYHITHVRNKSIVLYTTVFTLTLFTLNVYVVMCLRGEEHHFHHHHHRLYALLTTTLLFTAKSRAKTCGLRITTKRNSGGNCDAHHNAKRSQCSDAWDRWILTQYKPNYAWRLSITNTCLYILDLFDVLIRLVKEPCPSGLSIYITHNHGKLGFWEEAAM
jgi:hypothetical protein